MLVVLSTSQLGHAAFSNFFVSNIFGNVPSPQINNGASWGDEVTAYQPTMTTFGFKVHSTVSPEYNRGTVTLRVYNADNGADGIAMTEDDKIGTLIGSHTQTITVAAGQLAILSGFSFNVPNTFIYTITNESAPGEPELAYFVARTGNWGFQYQQGDSSGYTHWLNTTGPLAIGTQALRESTNGYNYVVDTAPVYVPPPNAAPTDITLTPASVKDGNVAGATVGKLAAVDSDANDSHTFSLVSGDGDADNASFAVSGSNLIVNVSSDITVKTSYLVRLRATDSGTGSKTVEKAFTITVLEKDLTPPVFAVGAPVVVEASSAAGAIVVFTAPVATDAADGIRPVICTPASGSLFPLGMTEVTCTASDLSGNEASTKFTVTVSDTTGPTFSGVPIATLTVEAEEPSGARVTFPTITASDAVDGASEVELSEVSGSLFALGLTTITCTAQDTRGNTSQTTFRILVLDRVGPEVTLPSPGITREATSAAGAIVNFSDITGNDLVDGARPVTFVPPSGSAFRLGTTTVTSSSSDTSGNTTSGTFTVTITDTTGPEILGLPEGGRAFVEAIGPGGAMVTFGLVAADAVNGTVTVTTNPPDGSALPLGSMQVTATAVDARNNRTTRTFQVTVRDSTAPVIIALPAPTGFVVGSALPDYLLQARAFDVVGVTSFTQTPTAGTILSVGEHEVTLTARDAAGNERAFAFTVTAVAAPPVVQLFTEGSSIPASSGVRSGSKWKVLGAPSVNDLGHVAFDATFTTPTGSGIFACSPENFTASLRAIALSGQSAPGISKVIYSRLPDEPLLDPHHSGVAYLARLDDIKLALGELGTVFTSNDEALYYDADGAGPNTPILAAREGESTIQGISANIRLGADKSNVPTFTSVALANQRLFFTAPMRGINQNGLFEFDAATRQIKILLSTGVAYLGSTISKIDALQANAETMGQGRAALPGTGSTSAVICRITLANARQLLADVSTSGEANPIYMTGPDGSGISGYGSTAQYLTFGLPTASASTGAMCFLATIKSGSGSATAQNNTAIFMESDDLSSIQRVVHKQGLAPGAGGGRFSSLGNPASAGSGRVLFSGGLASSAPSKITTLNNKGLWYKLDAREPFLIARRGSSAPGVAGGIFADFDTYALPEGTRGPIFVAKLKVGSGGITSGTDTGLWAMDSLGVTHLIIREGQSLNGKVVQSFSVLTQVARSEAQVRSFNNQGTLIWLAKFTDGSRSMLATGLE